jgi:type III secretion protein J
MQALRRILMIAVLLVLTACKVELFSGLTEREANDMLAILLRYDIPAAKAVTKDDVSLTVEEGRFAEAVDLLKRYGYPREAFNSIGEVFKKEGLISSPLEERIRFIYALSQELSQTISQIDGVLGARVHVVLPENDFGDRTTLPSSAAVFIRHQADVQLDQLIPQIKMLVTNSIEGLTYDKVTVVLFPVDADFVPPATRGMTHVAGVQLSNDSVETFWLMLGGLGLVALLGLAGSAVMFWLWRSGHGKATGTPNAAG